MANMESVDLHILDVQYEDDEIIDTGCIKIEIDEQFVDKEGIHDRKEYTENYEEKNIKTEISWSLENRNDFIYSNIEPNNYNTRDNHVNREEKVENLTNSNQSIFEEHNYSIYNYDEKYKCKLCDYASYITKNLEQHVLSAHFNIKKHEFSGTRIKRNPKRHSEVRMNKKNHKCNMCDYATKTNRDLKIHVETVHFNNNIYECSECDFATGLKGSLKRHIENVHLNFKKHNCHMCDYETNVKKNLERHIIAVHSNIRDHKCSMCEYATNSKTDLKEHVRNEHLDARKFKCNTCDYATNTKRDLKMHVETAHFIIKKYECNDCDFSTFHEENLKRHLESVHLNINGHNSSMCDYETYVKENLNIHTKAIHSNNR